MYAMLLVECHAIVKNFKYRLSSKYIVAGRFFMLGCKRHFRAIAGYSSACRRKVQLDTWTHSKRLGTFANFTVQCLIAGLVLLSVSFANAEPIRGAGSTFAAPIIAKWAKNYQTARADGGDFISPDWTVDYEPVGSLAGVMRLGQPEMDFAATDTPMTPADVAKRGYIQFPIVIGGVAIVTNIEGVSAGTLRLSGDVLAEIYLGKIQNWSDPAIRAINPDLTLPDQKISVLHRKDGSGTTFVFTQYLSGVNAEWKAKYGADTLITWPLGSGAEGTQGLLRAIAATKGAIGYVEFGQVARAKLSFALIQNRDGKYIRPAPENFQAAANAVDWTSTKDFYQYLTDQPGETAYPIVAATFAIVPAAGIAAARIRRVQDVFGLAFDKGGDDATALGYVPLPPLLVEKIKRYWADSARPGG